MMTKRMTIPVLALFFSLLACNLGGVTAPTQAPTTQPEPSATPTEATSTPTTTPQPTATPEPTAEPTTAVPPTTEGSTSTPIRFEAGADRAFVEGQLLPNQSDLYTLRALEDQQAAFLVRSQNPRLLIGVGGAVNPEIEPGPNGWRGVTTGGVVTIEITGAEGASGAYRLDVIILPPGDDGTPQLTPEQFCQMNVEAEADVLFTPSPSSEVFASGSVIAGEAVRVVAMTPDNSYYALAPGVAQAARTGANRLRWVSADDATIEGLCEYVTHITLAEVEADVAFDARPFCEVSFTGEQAYSFTPGGPTAGSFSSGASTLAYAVTGESLGVVPPEPRYGRYGLERLVWVPLSATTLDESPGCVDLETVTYP